MSSKELRGYLIAHMVEIHPANIPADQHMHQLAKLYDAPNQMIVVDHPRGKAWQWCMIHNLVYEIRDECPGCLAGEGAAIQPAAEPEGAPVQPLNTPL